MRKKNKNNMGDDIQCCKPQKTEEELDEIFTGCPDDNQIPDILQTTNFKGGKYPANSVDRGEFTYETNYPGNVDPRPTVIRNLSQPEETNYMPFRSAAPRQPFEEYPQDSTISDRGNYDDINQYQPKPTCLPNPSYEPFKSSVPHRTYGPDEIPQDEEDLPPINDDEAGRLLRQFNQEGTCLDHGDFNRDGWRELYPEEASFFLYSDTTPVVKDQTRVYNGNDYNYAEVYRGSVNPDNDLPHGNGESFSRRGARIGTWRNGEFTGWGRETKRGPDGEYIETKFVNGEKGGRQIIYNDRKRTKYKGSVIGGERDGIGTYDTPTYTYEGDFSHGKIEGMGKIVYKGKGDYYEGSFRDGELEGRGVFHFNNGDVYEGTMREGKMDGRGIYKYRNGDVYEGEYFNNKKEGQGVLTSADGKVWRGEFIGGKRVKNSKTQSVNNRNY